MRAVFLDRDGVINGVIVKEGRPYPPPSLVKLEILPGVKEALDDLHEAGYLLIVITNQPDVARGITCKSAVDEIHEFMMANFPITQIKACFHDDADQCGCRKPKPGAIIKAAREYHLNLNDCYMVGDRWRDIDAGILAGCKTIFIDYQYDEKQPTETNFIVKSLLEASKIIIGESNE
jgi:D-glycero-D-manno-heptose 1,7-bisphosphate phosphatase